MRTITTLILAALFAGQTNAQLVINEYSAANMTQYVDNFEKTEDWVEIYNTSSQPVDLSDWHFSDKVDKPTKWSFPDGMYIGGNGYLLVHCSGRDLVNGTEVHSNFKISQTKANEVLVLSDPSGTVVDEVPVQIHHLHNSWARNSNGSPDWKITDAPTRNANNNGTFYKDRYAERPTIAATPGHYSIAFTTEVTNNDPTATLHYTTDGNLPTEDSPVVDGPIEITETMVLKVRAYDPDPKVAPSLVAFCTYFINDSFTLPVLSVAADELLDLANGQKELRPIGSIEYFDKDGNFISQSYGELNSHGQDSWINPHRSLDWVSRDEMGYNGAVIGKFFHHTERDVFQRVMMRASGDDNYPSNGDFNHQGATHIRDEYVHQLALDGDMQVDVRSVRRMIVFLNGEYWGVYGVREKPADHDYTKYYYDQDKFNLQYMLTWGGTWAEYGGNETLNAWAEFRDFILNNDMGDPANYEKVKSEMKLVSMIDYMIANLNSVASDWLNYNTGVWRGMDPDGDHKKWGYILWDNDATFDYYINYSGVPNTDPDAVPCDIDDISNFMDQFYSNGNNFGSHEKLFLKLQQESDEFRQLYYSRQADLQNTVYTCENMTTTLNNMLAVIEPEMPRQIARWGGSMQEWEDNVAFLKQFIADRCLLLDEGMRECFNLTGPFPLTLNVVPEGVGEIDLNTLDIEEFPWSGNYYGGMTNLIKAKAFEEDEYVFDYWEVVNGSEITPNVNERSAQIEVTGGETLIAHFKPGSSVSTEELALANDLSIFPTLTEDFITVQFNLEEASDVNIALVSVDGKNLETQLFLQKRLIAGSFNQTFDLDKNIPAGVYLVHVNINGVIQTQKIVVGKS